MNKLLQSVRALPLALPFVAAAQGVPADALAAARTLVAQAAAVLAPAGARVEVVPGAVDGRLRLAPCEQVEPYLPAGTRPWGATRVGLRCLKGERPWNVSLPVTVKVFAPAPVALAPLAAGSVIEATQLARAEVDWAAEPSAVLVHADHLAGRTLARTVAAGKPLRAADLRPRQWFAAGDMVRIVAVGDDGQVARVRTDSGRVLSGQPSGERRLEVTP